MSDLPVVVIGAGLTGALVAAQLRRTGCTVRVLEAGPRPPHIAPSCTQSELRVCAEKLPLDHAAWHFESDVDGLEWMRVRAMGGRTWLWGGWLERPSAAALAWAESRGAGWPIARTTLDRALGRASRWLRAESSKATPPLGDTFGRLRPKRAALGPGGLRPWTAWDVLAPDSVHTDHPAVGLTMTRGRVRAVEVLVGPERRPESIPARAVVACASPVESARLVASLGGSLAARVGRDYVDHLVAGRMVLHPRPAAPRKGPLDRAFILRTRDPLATVEITGPFAATDLTVEDRAALGIPEADAARWSFTAVYAFTELDPAAGRAVHFDGPLDTLGRKSPRFALGTPSPDEIARAMTTEALVNRMAKLAAKRKDEIVQTRPTASHDIVGHEAGVCRMAERAKDGVTDPYGRVFGAKGLYVGDASRMPSVFDTHPSLTIAALALMTADAVLADLH